MARLLALAILATATAVVQPAAGCSWPAKFEADSTNVAFPDDNANYWLARFAVGPGLRLRIEGTYPTARYFSFHVYDASQAPIDGIADYEIDPDLAGGNRFREPDAGPGTYTVFVEAGDRPAIAAANTIYAGAGNQSEMLIYRVYVGDDPASPQGSVPLPRLTIETAAGVPLGDCEPLPPSTQDVVSEAIRDANLPNEVPRGLPYPPAQDPPRFVKFWGTVHEFARRFPQGAESAPKNGGFLSNRHISYLYALFSRQEGDLVVMRAKAPTAPDTRGGDPVTSPANLRYFSICQNELATQRFVECLRDDEIVLDDAGWFTIVVSDPEDRPENAVNWLPWGGAYYDGNLIYRHMLPQASFAEAIQNVPYGAPEAATMGDYYPSIAYCSRAEFEADAC